MSDAKPPKAAAPKTNETPYSQRTPAEAARNKKNRDARRISIRQQNLRSKVK